MEKRMETLLAAYVPFPACVINGKGKVTRASSKIEEVFIYDGIKDADIYQLTGIKYSTFSEGSDKGLFLSRNDKVFKILTKVLSEKEGSSILLCFQDVTNYENLKTLYNEEKICIAVVCIDNFDELSSITAEDKTAELTTQIDRAVRQWAAKMNASLTKYKAHMYMLVMEKASCDKLIENKFAILDEIRGIETETDFPATLSIGIGVGGKTPAVNNQFAQAALELAQGRGGDQAVIRRGSKTEYYGGKMQTVEKSNKGRSRIMAHALRHVMEQSSKVIIMGHKNPDTDSFGASLGIFRLAATINKETHIVVEKYHENLSEIYKQAADTGIYSFVNAEKALKLADKDTLIIVVDTHRPSITECPELLKATDKIVVIDHHRKHEEAIENPILAYMEPYASSASELVAEMLQYSRELKGFSKFEAEALLAGITVDTNRFAGQTGVRTFEAASWLRRAGADTSAVKRFFQSDEHAFKIKAAAVARAEFLEGGIAMTVCEGPHTDMQIINAQAADTLLEIKGMKASFVAGTYSEGITAISARSLGEVNVQLIMESFGGGGHLMTAGAQTDLSPEEVLKKLKELLLTKSD